MGDHGDDIGTQCIYIRVGRHVLNGSEGAGWVSVEGASQCCPGGTLPALPFKLR